MSCIGKKRLENHLDVHVNITLWKLPCSIGKFCEIYRFTVESSAKLLGGKKPIMMLECLPILLRRARGNTLLSSCVNGKRKPHCHYLLVSICHLY